MSLVAANFSAIKAYTLIPLESSQISDSSHAKPKQASAVAAALVVGSGGATLCCEIFCRLSSSGRCKRFISAVYKLKCYLSLNFS